MSSIIAPHDDKTSQTGQRRIWLPTECWVDTLKLLSRRQLLRGVQPACRRLHAIAELHLPSVHIVRHLDQFFDAYARNRREANRQYAELASSQAELARHFQLGADVEFQIGRRSYQRQAGYKRRRRAQIRVLRHSTELFNGCRLHVAQHNSITSAERLEYLAYLSLLATARPFSIEVVHETKSSRLHPDELLREPTVLACSKLNWKSNGPSAETIYHWLHHFPTELEEENAEQNSIKTRIFNLDTLISLITANEIIERCKQSLQQAESASDQHTFLLIIQQLDGSPIPHHFKLENRASGEVLQLEERGLLNAARSVWHWSGYHLRRCPMTELANADNFYRDTFVAAPGQTHLLEFRTPIENGLQAPILTLH